MIYSQGITVSGTVFDATSNEPLPGEPEPEVMLTPETCPCSACSTRVGFSFSIVPEPTTVTAPVTSFLVCVPYPITTISSSLLEAN